jgi:hypothetical protein
VYPAILWPEESFDANFSFVLDINEIFSSQLMHIAVIITFGITSPPLLGAIVATICIEYYSWRVIIGRFLKLFSDDVLLEKVREICYDAWHCPKQCIWIILPSSVVFIVFFTLDMACDKMSFERAIWIPIFVGLLFGCLVLYLNSERIKMMKERESESFNSNIDEDGIVLSESFFKARSTISNISHRETETLSR